MGGTMEWGRTSLHLLQCGPRPERDKHGRGGGCPANYSRLRAITNIFRLWAVKGSF